MDIVAAILNLHPGADPALDFVVRDDLDGSGPQIVEWNLPGLQPTIPELEAVEPTAVANKAAAEAIAEINRIAGIVRQQYITVSPGQELIYMLKDVQSRAYAAAGYTGTVPPFVQSEANATGLTAQQAADSIIAQADAWSIAGSAIDEAKRTGTIAIEAARVALDPAAIETAKNTAVTAISAL